jgi:hypothetical protein
MMVSLFYANVRPQWLGNMQHNTSAPMAVLTQFMSLACLAQWEGALDHRLEMPLVAQASEVL